MRQHKSNARIRSGFSLLEVIIATAILAASGVMLMSMFSTGDRHARRAEKRALAQMLCQSKMDELLANPNQLQPIETQVFQHYPGWIYSVALHPTALEGFVQLSLSVTHIPGTDIGANMALATADMDEQSPDLTALAPLSAQPTFRLVRWLEFEGDVTGFGEDSSSSAASLGAVGL